MISLAIRYFTFQDQWGTGLWNQSLPGLVKASMEVWMKPLRILVFYFPCSGNSSLQTAVVQSFLMDESWPSPPTLPAIQDGYRIFHLDVPLRNKTSLLFSFALSFNLQGNSWRAKLLAKIPSVPWKVRIEGVNNLSRTPSLDPLHR